MEKIVEAPTILEDGRHEGMIIGVEYRDEPYEYCDVIIEVENIKMKVGYPFKIMPDSLLGILLVKFGAKMEIGTMIDPDKILIGRKAKFLTMQSTTKNGTYANIVRESVEPIKE